MSSQFFLRRLIPLVLVMVVAPTVAADVTLPDPFWEVGLFSNMKLFVVVVFSMMVQIGIHHVPATQALFGIGPLSLADCGLSIAIGAIPLAVIELEKVCRRWWFTEGHVSRVHET